MILLLEMLQDEIQILKAVTEGDEKAFKKLFLYYYPKVVAFIREIVKDTKAAEDTAQDIFAKIWLIRLSLSGIHNFGSYLYVVSRNAALHYLKKSCPSVRIDEIDFIVDSAIDEKIQADEKESAIRKAVSEMSDRRREVFIKSRWEGKSNEEIAQEMGITKKTVENTLNAALKEIRKFLSVIIFFS